jgi:hypothetical protein
VTVVEFLRTKEAFPILCSILVEYRPMGAGEGGDFFPFQPWCYTGRTPRGDRFVPNGTPPSGLDISIKPDRPSYQGPISF